jgi:SAM-dependent methyltransferase
VGVAAPFDALAADYDRCFTASVIGRRMRAAVWRRLDKAFVAGERVLELNCGTGEDAIHLGARGVRILATDGSPAMLSRARAKIEATGLSATIEVERLRIENLADLAGLGTFDGAVSNFGGLNCVNDLPCVASRLAVLLRPGARVLLCVMGPTVPWEWAWYLAHGQPGKAARRLRRDGAGWRGLTLR